MVNKVTSLRVPAIMNVLPYRSRLVSTITAITELLAFSPLSSSQTPGSSGISEYYVSADAGSDGDGSRRRPFASLSQAESAAAAGDVIYVIASTDRNIVFVPVGINYDHVLEDQNLLDWDNKDKRLIGHQHLRKFWQFLKKNLFVNSRQRWKRFGYANVNFGVPVSMSDYCDSNAVDFKHLNKEQRIPRVAELAAHLMEAVRYVMPIIPVPIISTVLLQAGEESLTSLEIVSGCDDLIDSMMQRGAAMRPEEKPRHRTLTRSLDLLKNRNMLIEEDDRYRINPQHRPLLQYYANSIEHWWR